MKRFLVVALLLLFAAPLFAEQAVIKGEKLQYEPVFKSAPGSELEDIIVMELAEDSGVKDDGEDVSRAGRAVEAKAVGKDIQLIDLRTSTERSDKIYDIDDCVDIAVKNHLQLDIAQKNIKLGEMRLWESRRNMLPSLSLKTEETFGEVYGRRYRGVKSSIEGQHTIFKGGEIYFTMKQAETNLKIVKEEKRRIENDLVAQVRKQFYGVAKSEENLKFQSGLKKEVDAVEAMVKKGFEEGAISKMEFLNVGSQSSQVDFQLLSARGDLDLARLILSQTMNVEPNDIFSIRADLTFRDVDVKYKKILEAAFANRPEIRIGSMMLDYYNYELRMTKARSLPKVDIMGSWGLAKENYIEEDNQPGANGNVGRPSQNLSQQWYGGFKASMPFWGSTGEYSFTREQWPSVVSAYQGTEARTNAMKLNILDNLKVYSEKQSAEIDYDRSRQEFIKSKHDVTLEVKEGCFNYEKAVVQLRTAEGKVKFQEKDTELMRFRRGLDETADSTVVESLIKLEQERFGYVQALTDYHASIAALNKAIGVYDYFGTGKRSDKDRGK